MSEATRNVIGEVGDIRTRCRSLLNLLDRVSRTVDGTEELTAEQENDLRDATWRWGTSSKDYVDRAFDAVNEWHKQLLDVQSKRSRPNGR